MNNIIHLKYGTEDIAALVSHIPHRSHSMYKVIFEGGYENIFFTDVETGWWLEEDMGFTTLAKEVGQQIKKLSPVLFHVPKILIWHKQYADEKLVVFGFYKFIKGSHKMYEIYSSSKKYMCTLADMNNEDWQIMGTSTEMLHKSDLIFIQRIVKILPFYYTNV